MNASLMALLTVLVPVVTEAGVQWKGFPLERKNAPFAVLILSFLLAIGFVLSKGTFAWNTATVDSVFGYTVVTTAIATGLYEYVWKLVLIRGFKFLKTVWK